MSATATEIRLADCVDLLAGFAFKSDRFQDAGSGGVPLVKGENIGQGRILWDISRYWPSNEDGLDKFRLLPGDVVLAMDRPWVPAGLKWAVIRDGDPDAFLVQRCARLRSRSPDLRQDFLRYVIGGPGFEAYIRPITTGVNVPHISGAQILGYNFRLPPVEEQKRIAGILSAYDDLIENCERRIRVLDEMARSLYREWFVDFRFPGQDRSGRAAMPTTWRAVPLREVADVNAAKVDTRNPPAAIGYIDIASVSPGKIEAVNQFAFDDAPGRARRVVRHGDTLWSCVRPNRRSHALVVQPEVNTIASTGFAVLTPRRVPASYLYLATTTDEFVGYLEKRATGAAYPAVTGKDFEESVVVLPAEGVVAKFGETADTWFAAAAGLAKRIQNLRITRDLLLPRLLSGQLSVDDAA